MVLAQEGEESQSAGRASLRLRTLESAFDILRGQYNAKAALLRVT